MTCLCEVRYQVALSYGRGAEDGQGREGPAVIPGWPVSACTMPMDISCCACMPRPDSTC